MPDDVAKEITLLVLYETYESLGYDVFVFLSPASTWSHATSVLVGPESVYDNCEETDCGTPDWIFEMGFRYGFLTSDIYQVYVSAWIENAGADTFENFCRCMSNYVANDALTFPHTI